MWPSFYVCVISMYMCGKCVCVCVCVCLRAISGGKSEKVLAHFTKLSYTSVRCNICSSVTVNKGGNTSNIMIYLQNTTCNVLYLLCLPAHTFTSNVDSGVELRSRDTALIHNHKSTLFACAFV